MQTLMKDDQPLAFLKDSPTSKGALFFPLLVKKSPSAICFRNAENSWCHSRVFSECLAQFDSFANLLPLLPTPFGCLPVVVSRRRGRPAPIVLPTGYVVSRAVADQHDLSPGLLGPLDQSLYQVMEAHTAFRYPDVGDNLASGEVTTTLRTFGTGFRIDSEYRMRHISISEGQSWAPSSLLVPLRSRT